MRRPAERSSPRSEGIPPAPDMNTQREFGTNGPVTTPAAGDPIPLPVEEMRLPVHVALFDLLAYEGTDWRDRPYEDRRSGLTALVAPIGPPLQVTPVTTDPQEAADWYRNMHAVGIEGLVVKGLAQQYRP